jgi:hypothetical protein
MRNGWKAQLLLVLVSLPLWTGLGADQSCAQSAPSNRSEEEAVAERKPPPPEAYAGDLACAACHKEQSAAYPLTAHHLTSELPSEQSVGGNFKPGQNILHTAVPELTYEMTATNHRWFETAIMRDDPAKPITYTEPVDIVVGAGRKAKTYLYWRGDARNELFELPISFWTETQKWVYSPSYEDGTINFDRAVVPRCLDCHASYFQTLAPPVNRFARANLVLGITCEKCHGPGREHVDLMSSSHPPAAGEPMGIVKISSLPRDRQVDVCALCHAGAVRPLAPSLTFLPGDSIGKFLRITETESDFPTDVHSHQVQLLKSSRCYRSSNMTCSTCHNVHTPQRDADGFSQYCLNCHKPANCGKFAQMGAQLTGKCVGCHMPLQRSVVLFSEVDGQELHPTVRNHHIGIYPETPGAPAVP